MMPEIWVIFVTMSILIATLGKVFADMVSDDFILSKILIWIAVVGVIFGLYCLFRMDANDSLTEREEPETDINFELGALMATRGVADKMEDPDFAAYVLRCLGRYISCDWGEVSKADFQRNDLALKEDDRIFAVYEDEEHPDWRIYIITEWDRSATTVLFPDEY